MTTRPTSAILALAALLICSACAEQTTTHSFLAPHTTPQLTSLQWDEATAAQSMAHVNNSGMIAMR